MQPDMHYPIFLRERSVGFGGTQMKMSMSRRLQSDEGLGCEEKEESSYRMFLSIGKSNHVLTCMIRSKGCLLLGI